MTTPPSSTPVEYDEFSMFADNAAEVGLPFTGPPEVRRTSVDVGGGQQVSALVWGSARPEVVLIHGGAQNAHTWDTVALALGRPLVAIDLPGHGHSDWRDDHDYLPVRNAEAVSVAVEHLAPTADLVVGMSLGGLTSIRLAATRPDLVKRLMLIDVTPGVTNKKASAIVEFVSGPESFESLDEILRRTIEFNPTRSESSLRRGVLHNARAHSDGTWRWRYDRLRRPGDDAASADPADTDRYGFRALWDDVSAITAPIVLVRGALPSTVVDDADEAELKRRQPTARAVLVEGAGHSVQGDQPRELARLIEEFLAS